MLTIYSIPKAEARKSALRRRSQRYEGKNRLGENRPAGYAFPVGDDVYVFPGLCPATRLKGSVSGGLASIQEPIC